MIIYATYYDHIERAGYRPDVAITNWMSCDKRIVCCSPEDGPVLLSMGIDAEIIDVGININTPGDIALAQNASMNAAFDAGADTVMYIAGDAYLTAAGDRFVKEFIRSRDDPFGLMMVQAVELYSKIWKAFAVSISSKKARVEYKTGAVVFKDGAELNHIGSLSDDDNLILDIGYLGVEQFSKKMTNHNYIWPNKDKVRWTNLYKANPNEAIRLRYSQLRSYMQRPLVPVNKDLYWELLDVMGLEDDYERCMGILKDFT